MFTNPIQLSTFRCRCMLTLELMRLCWSYQDVEHSSRLGRPSCFWGCLSFIFYLRRRHDLVESVPLAFLSYLFQTLLVLFWYLYIYAIMNYFLHLNISLLDGCGELMWYISILTMMSMYTSNQKKVLNFPLKLTYMM